MKDEKGFKQYKNGSKGEKPRTDKKKPVGARFSVHIQTGQTPLHNHLQNSSTIFKQKIVPGKFILDSNLSGH
jgi:hypothetical protein